VTLKVQVIETGPVWGAAGLHDHDFGVPDPLIDVIVMPAGSSSVTV
jgi:hypothetical protein